MSIIKNGYGLNSPFFIFYLKKDDILAEFGICAGKKLGCAVIRNRAKRRIRELIRYFLQQFEFNGSLVIMARKQIITADFESLKKFLPCFCLSRDFFPSHLMKHSTEAFLI